MGQMRYRMPITIRSDAHTEEIATVWTCLLPTEANARLIAASPTMAELLKRISTTQPDAMTENDMRHYLLEYRQTARALLAKIEGDA